MYTIKYIAHVLNYTIESNEEFFCPVVCKETCLTLVSGKVKMPALLSSFFAKKNFDTSLLMPNKTPCFEFGSKCDIYTSIHVAI